ncbi:CDC50/LEM3 family [Ilyonectria sp. MPI-CAGE-AT-0026]|nr:CDC50/LEM3 family [Ilyonectria sp. MPI-CAGE-AT-0026]
MGRFWKKQKKVEGEVRSRRPKDTPYKQQSMKAWEEIRLDYTRCHELKSYDEFETMPAQYTWKYPLGESAGHPVDRWKRANRNLTFDGITKNYTFCTIEFYLPDGLKPPVLFYYHLTNFFQNHRNYGTSRLDAQLKGESVSLKSVKDSACKDVAVVKSSDGGPEKPVYPCGLIAASYFNDTFGNPRRLSVDSGNNPGRGTTYNMSREGIALSYDKSLYKLSTYNITAIADSSDSPVVPPPSWAERYPRGYHKGNMFDPSSDESFMVWMRTASSPRFAKLAKRNDNDTMEKGLYSLSVFSDFPIHQSGGSKSIIISTRSAGGARNPFLGVANIATGGACILLSGSFALSTLWKSSPLVYHSYLHRSH